MGPLLGKAFERRGFSPDFHPCEDERCDFCESGVFLARKVVKVIFKYFEKLQEKLEGESYVTISLLPNAVMKINNIITKVSREALIATLLANVRAYGRSITATLKTKFEERFGTMSDPSTIFKEHETANS